MFESTDLPAPLPYIQGDTLPAISGVYQLEDDAGNVTAVNITGWVFTLVYVKGTAALPVQVTKIGTVDDGPNGLFSFHWAPGDLDTVGSFDARITATNPAGIQSWQSLTLAVARRVGT